MRASILILLASAAMCLVPQYSAAQTPDNQSSQTFNDPMAKVQAFLDDPGTKRRQYSAENGDPYAMVWLADEIQKKAGGNWTAERKVLPFRVKFYMGAIAQDYPEAFNRMGSLVLDGQMPEGTPMDAVNFFQQGAELGDLDSIIGFAKLAQDPLVCSICSKTSDDRLLLETESPDNKEGTARERGDRILAAGRAAGEAYISEKREMANSAIGFLNSDAAKDSWTAQDRLARIYLRGISRPRLNGYGFFDSGDASLLYVVKPQPPKAKPILERLSDKGVRGAHELLGDLYFVGTYEGFPRDRSKFIKYMRLSADSGNVGSAYKLGHELVSGQNFEPDFDIGATYLNMAHQKGYSAATVDLAFMFYGGRGFPENTATALALFEEAANNGSSKGAQFLADWWRDGLGGTRNPLRAKLWQDKADELKASEARGQELIDKMNAL